MDLFAVLEFECTYHVGTVTFKHLYWFTMSPMDSIDLLLRFCCDLCRAPGFGNFGELQCVLENC